jgi:hypothetical protein
MYFASLAQQRNYSIEQQMGDCAALLALLVEDPQHLGAEFVLKPSGMKAEQKPIREARNRGHTLPALTSRSRNLAWLTTVCRRSISAAKAFFPSLVRVNTRRSSSFAEADLRFDEEVGGASETKPASINFFRLSYNVPGPNL